METEACLVPKAGVGDPIRSMPPFVGIRARKPPFGYGIVSRQFRPRGPLRTDVMRDEDARGWGESGRSGYGVATPFRTYVVECHKFGMLGG